MLRAFLSAVQLCYFCNFSKLSAINVLVHLDAIYDVKDDMSVCAGSGALPVSTVCPRRGDVAIGGCHSGLPSWNQSHQRCVALEDAKCVVLDGNWKCRFLSTKGIISSSNNQSCGQMWSFEGKDQISDSMWTASGTQETVLETSRWFTRESKPASLGVCGKNTNSYIDVSVHDKSNKNGSVVQPSDESEVQPLDGIEVSLSEGSEVRLSDATEVLLSDWSEVQSSDGSELRSSNENEASLSDGSETPLADSNKLPSLLGSGVQSSDGSEGSSTDRNALQSSDGSEEPLSDASEEPASNGSEEPVSDGSEGPVSAGSEEPSTDMNAILSSNGSEEPVSDGSEGPVSAGSEEPSTDMNALLLSNGRGEPVSDASEEPASDGSEEPLSNGSEESGTMKVLSKMRDSEMDFIDFISGGVDSGWVDFESPLPSSWRTDSDTIESASTSDFEDYLLDVWSDSDDTLSDTEGSETKPAISLSDYTTDILSIPESDGSEHVFGELFRIDSSLSDSLNSNSDSSISAMSDSRISATSDSDVDK